MVVDERIVLEIVRPGTSDPVGPGEVGEIGGRGGVLMLGWFVRGT